MHAGVWETVADALLWMQLCWVFSGFLLMGYLAFKVFPSPSKPTPSAGLTGFESGATNLLDRRKQPDVSSLLRKTNSSLESGSLRRKSDRVIEFQKIS